MEGVPKNEGSGVLDGNVVTGNTSKGNASAMTDGMKINNGTGGTKTSGEIYVFGKNERNDANCKGSSSYNKWRPDRTTIELGC